MLAGVLACVLFTAGPVDVVAPRNPAPERISVEDAVREALSRNHDLLAERARVPAADADVRTAGLRPNPVTSVSADHLPLAGTQFTEENGGGPPEYTWRTDYLWELGGKRDRRLDVAGHQRGVTRMEVADRERQLVLEVRDAFVDLLLAQKTLELAEASAAALGRVADLSTARVRSGDLAEVELLRTRVARVNLENEVRLKGLASRAAQQRLAYLLGRPASRSGLEASGEFRESPAGAAPLDRLEASAAEQRPDLLALSADLSRAEADLRLQQSISRIDFTVGGEFRRQQGVNGTSNSLGFFLSMPLPLFDRNQGAVARAQAEAVRAVRRVDGLRAAIGQEVRAAYDRLETARGLADRIEREMMSDAREVRAVTEYAYQRGQASLIELLDAQRVFNDTMQGYLNAKAEVARSLNLLDAVTGKSDIR
jgi:cobalt-zinc-cadmium efflux system outer membrane protein